jgi:hypothetical protein
MEHGDAALAQSIYDLEEQLDALRQLRPTLFGHLARALVMVAVLLVAWYRVAFDGYSDIILYVAVGGIGVWCATIVGEALRDRRRQLRLERELELLLSSDAREPPPIRSD